MAAPNICSGPMGEPMVGYWHRLLARAQDRTLRACVGYCGDRCRPQDC